MATNKRRKTFYISGMHCSACESLIEGDIKKNYKLNTVKASLKDEKVTVAIGNSEKLPSIEKLNDDFKSLGYSFYDSRDEIKKTSRTDILISVGIVILILAIFVLAEKFGGFGKFTINPTSSYINYFVFGLVAGISSCAALVGGILISLSTRWNKANKQGKKYVPFVMFNTGRIVSFAILGGLLGFLGSIIGLSLAFTSILIIVISLFMILIGLQMTGVSFTRGITFKTPSFVSKYIDDESNVSKKYVPFVIGALTFFVPCGFTLIAQSNVILTGSFVTGAILMTAFALGTLPMLALLSFSSVKLYSHPRFNKFFNLAAGLLIIFFALYTLKAQLNVVGFTGFDFLKRDQAQGLVQTTNVSQAKEQILAITANDFEYSPSSVNLKAGIPTKMVINNKGAVGCANALYARGLYDQVVLLKSGVNEVNIPAPKAGTYKITCSMGMVEPITVYVR